MSEDKTTPKLLARFEVVGEDDDKSLRGWTEGDKQESTHDELTVRPDAWPLGTVVEVRASGEATQREPFGGFSEASEEQRAIATNLATHFVEAFENAGLQTPTVDHAILSNNLRILADDALKLNPKTSKIVRAIFDSSTAQGQASTLMLAGLLLRLYAAPYGSLNEAGLDFVNVLVAVLDVAGAKTSRVRKHPGG